MYKKLLNWELLCSKDELYPRLVFSNSVATLQCQSWNSRSAAGQEHRMLIKVEQRHDRNPVQHFPMLWITVLFHCHRQPTDLLFTPQYLQLAFFFFFPKNCAHLQFWLVSPGISVLLGAFTDFHTAESLFMVPLRGTQYTLSSAVPDSRKSFEASTPETSWKITGWRCRQQRYCAVWSWDAMDHTWKMGLSGAGYEEAEQWGIHLPFCRVRSTKDHLTNANTRLIFPLPSWQTCIWFGLESQPQIHFATRPLSSPWGQPPHFHS